MIEKELQVLKAMRGKLGPDPERRLIRKLPLNVVKEEAEILEVLDGSKTVDANSACPSKFERKIVPAKTCQAKNFKSFLII